MRKPGTGCPFIHWSPALFLAGIVLLVVLKTTFEWYASLIDLAFIVTGVPFWLIWRKMCGQQGPE